MLILGRRGGRYKAVIIVFEGRVVVAPYDDEGPDYDNAAELFPGQRIKRQGEIK